MADDRRSRASRIESNFHSASPAIRITRVAGEAVLFLLVAISPWPLASTSPPYESALAAGVLLLVSLWAAHAALTGRLGLRPDGPTVFLGGLALWTAFQLVPLPETVVGVISPTRLTWHHDLLPAQTELLPGESGPLPRPTVLPLTVDPSATRTFLAQTLSVLLVYLSVRNWLATPAAFARFAWLMTFVGTGLAFLGLAQLFTSKPQVIYWSIAVDGGVFGPFVCKNHFPDFVLPCLGLAAGLLLSRPPKSEADDDGPFGALLAPRGLILIAAIGLMAVSVAFSLSRGGIVAAPVAFVGAATLTRFGRRANQSGGYGALVITVAVGVSLGLAAWFGVGPIEKRVESIATRSAVDSRLPIWRDSARLIPDVWATGTGGGTYVWAEPLVRTDRPSDDVVEFAHNEYLEAIIEGGVVRLGLTLGLVASLLISAGRAFVRQRGLAGDSLILGAWFGLAAAAAHAVVEFGIHIPAVAILTATLAGFATATPPQTGPTERAGRAGGWGVFVGLILAGIALFVALDARSRDRSHRLKLDADEAYWQKSSPDRLARRAVILDARATLRPHDPQVLFDAAQGHLDAAVEATLAGPARAVGERPVERFSPDVVDRHIHPALRLLRAARAANPIAPKPHTRLALFGEAFVAAEPARAHFDRAKRVLPRDPDLWFTSGRHALRLGDTAAAAVDWRESLRLSRQRLEPILTLARGRMLPGDILANVLPDDPAVILAAADRYFPDRETQATARRPFLDAAATAVGPGRTATELAAAAAALDELGRTEEALATWRVAVERDPEDGRIRDLFSRVLDREERYDEAIPHLEWLRRRGTDPIVQDRLDRARHGLKLGRALRPNG